MSANPHTNGGLLLRELRLPNFRDYAVQATTPGAVTAESTRIMRRFLRDVMKMNMESRNFRLLSPDENNSNRWQDALAGCGKSAALLPDIGYNSRCVTRCGGKSDARWGCDKLIDHKQYIARHGDDMSEITGWGWGYEAASAGVRSTEADNV
jgi:phosphoketolase